MLCNNHIYHESFKIQNTKGRNSGQVVGLGLGAADRWPRQQQIGGRATADRREGEMAERSTTTADREREKVFSCFLRVGWML